MKRLGLLLATSMLAAGIAYVGAQTPPPVPALPDSPRVTSYLLTASNCACSVGFAIYGDGTDVDNWIDVFVNGVSVPSSSSTAGWGLTSPTGPLGSIPRPITNAVLTFNAPQSGTISIVGARRPRRLSQFQEGRGVTARDLNQVITDEIAMLRENWDLRSRMIVGQPGENFNPLPPASTRAGKLLAFDAGGQPIVSSQQTSIVTDAPIVGSKTLSLTNSFPLPPVDLVMSLPANGYYASGSGALFSTCPLTYSPTGGSCGPNSGGTGVATTYAAQYLKATATHDSSIAEYMVVNDCNLNSGKGGSQVGSLNDNKVCMYNSVVTGANAGSATWVQANNLALDAADTGVFKINTEMDMTNKGADCAPGSGRICYVLTMGAGGAGINPITSYINLTTPSGITTPAAHFGILINGDHVASPTDGVDIENSGGASVGICNGCLTRRNHSRSAFEDRSTAQYGLFLGGSYATASVTGPGFAFNSSGYLTTPGIIMDGATPLLSAAGQVVMGGTTTPASMCGSLSGAAGCIQMSINGTTRYVPFF